MVNLHSILAKNISDYMNDIGKIKKGCFPFQFWVIKCSNVLKRPKMSEFRHFPLFFMHFMNIQRHFTKNWHELYPFFIWYITSVWPKLLLTKIIWRFTIPFFHEVISSPKIAKNRIILGYYPILYQFGDSYNLKILFS